MAVTKPGSSSVWGIQKQYTAYFLGEIEKNARKEILFRFDLSRFPAAPANAIRAGMRRAVATAVKTAGFRMKKPVKTAPAAREQQAFTEALAPLQAVVSHYDLANMSPADEISFYNRLREAGITR